MTPQRLIHFACMATFPVLIIVAWEVAARAGMVSAFLLPAFSKVIARMIEDFGNGTLTDAAFGTLYRLVISYTIAVVLGVALGILMARVKVFRWFLDPIVSIGFPAPKIAFLPIFILWFGVFDAPKIVMASFSCIFPIIGGTWAGTQGVDKYLIWSAENLGTDKRTMLWRIILPAALPQILTAMQVALPIAFIVVVVAEMLTAGGGLGGAMISATRIADPAAVFANLLIVGILGFAAMKGLQFARRRILSWHEEVQQEESIA
jgi:ABC-type nitrate/sulfonate/bicarbonate transport system permease component